MTKGQAELRVPCYVEEEFAVAAGEGKLVFWWAAKWNTTEHEWPRIEGELLLTVFSLLADEADSLELFDSKLREADGRKNGLKRSKRHITGGREPRSRPSAYLRWGAL